MAGWKAKPTGKKKKKKTDGAVTEGTIESSLKKKKRKSCDFDFTCS